MPRRLALALLLLVPRLLPAAVPLEMEVWCELEPMIQEGEDFPLSPQAARQQVLDEARGLLSAMIYGASFTYVPADAQRKTAEEFRLAPLAEVAWGDRRLRITEADLRGDRLYARVRYELADFQDARRRAWESNLIPTSSGLGRTSLFTASPPEGKRRSLQEALKDAVRNHLRPVLFNKPREVRGELLLWEPPRTLIDAGDYLTTLTVKLRVTEVRPYSLF